MHPETALNFAKPVTLTMTISQAFEITNALELIAKSYDESAAIANDLLKSGQLPGEWSEAVAKDRARAAAARTLADQISGTASHVVNAD